MPDIRDAALELGAVAEVKGRRISEIGEKLVQAHMLGQPVDPAIIDIIDRSTTDLLIALLAMREAQRGEMTDA